ncbi:MAG: gamma-mobile-trio protein GmtX [Actinomycetota bacterium]
MSHIPAVDVDLEQARSTLEVVYARILETGEADSGKRIWEACEFLSKNKSKKITASAVGEYCSQKYGGPKAQSISNKQDTLAQLVRWWNIVHLLQSGRAAKTGAAKPSNVVFDNPAAEAYVRILESQIKELRASNERLNKAFRELKPLQIGSVPNSPGVEALPPSTGLSVTDTEREAIRVFLSPSHLSKFDLHFDDRQRIKDGTKVLVERPVIEVLLRLVGQK